VSYIVVRGRWFKGNLLTLNFSKTQFSEIITKNYYNVNIKLNMIRNV